jgi:hypothetical protein
MLHCTVPGTVPYRTLHCTVLGVAATFRHSDKVDTPETLSVAVQV